MAKVSSAEQAAKECIELWEQIEEICDDEHNHHIITIKYDIIGERHYLSDCPLCEYYGDVGTECPLSTGAYSCKEGCFEYGFKSYMNRDEIKSFLKTLKEKLEVE